MTHRSPALGLCASMILAGSAARAQDRASEDALFGGSADAGTRPPSSEPSRPSESELFSGSAPDAGTSRPNAPAMSGRPASGPASLESSRDERGLAAPPSPDVFATEPTRDDPLRIGGQLYLRSQASASEGVSLSNTRIFLPALVDGYFDARPIEGVRGMVVGRLTYDPTIDPNASVSAFGVPTSSNPAVLLDQLWINLDIARTVFVTAGRQHVKWQGAVVGYKQEAEDNYIFNVESVCGLKVENVVMKAADVLEDKIKDFQKNLKKLK